MSYPYGNYTPVTLALLRDAGCVGGLTNRVDLASDLSRSLELPRLDIIDLPYVGEAPPCEWRRQVASRTLLQPAAGGAGSR